MKTIFVLLTKYSDWVSCIVHYICAGEYTHVSISLEENKDIYYSFNYKGFCTETLEKHRHRGVNKSVSYEIQVSEDIYRTIRKTIQQFNENRKEYHYTRLGIIFAVLNIPFYWEKHYICSHFVAKVLKESGAVPLCKKVNTYLPNQFCKELERFTGLKRISYNVV